MAAIGRGHEFGSDPSQPRIETGALGRCMRVAHKTPTSCSKSPALKRQPAARAGRSLLGRRVDVCHATNCPAWLGVDVGPDKWQQINVEFAVAHVPGSVTFLVTWSADYEMKKESDRSETSIVRPRVEEVTQGASAL